MPELPEVEIARRNLASWIEGEALLEVRVDEGRSVRGDPEAYRRFLIGRRVLGTNRIGKHLLVSLEGGELAIHLGMSGRLVARGIGDEVSRHTRVQWSTATRRVCFIDPRIFGRTGAGAAREVRAEAGIDALGVDAMALESARELAAACGDTRSAIKVALMDQRRLAGVGNIQAAEALFRACVDPRMCATDLDATRWAALYTGLRGTLEYTLAVSSAEEIEYMSDGAHVTNPFLVYGREAEPCSRCATPIERFVQAARATFWCAECQS